MPQQFPECLCQNLQDLGGREGQQGVLQVLLDLRAQGIGSVNTVGELFVWEEEEEEEEENKAGKHTWWNLEDKITCVSWTGQFGLEGCSAARFKGEEREKCKKTRKYGSPQLCH